MEIGDERQQSEFNMAFSYLNRLNQLLWICNDAAMRLDPFEWFHALMALNRELSTEMKKDEPLQIKLLKENIKNELNQRNMNSHVEISPQLYEYLDDFETKLRKILKEAGLQTRMLTEAGKALR